MLVESEVDDADDDEREVAVLEAGQKTRDLDLPSARRSKGAPVHDPEIVEGIRLLARTEGILAALESSHAIAQTVKIARELPKDAIVLCNLSGRGDKDVDTASKWFGV